MSEKRDPLGRIEEAYRAWMAGPRVDCIDAITLFRAGYLAGLARAEEIARTKIAANVIGAPGWRVPTSAEIADAIAAERREA